MNQVDRINTLEKLAIDVAKNTGLDGRYVFYELWDSLAGIDFDALPEGDVFTPSLVKAANEWLAARKVVIRSGICGPRRDKDVMRVVAELTPKQQRVFNRAYNNPEDGGHQAARGLFSEARRVLGHG